MANSGLDEVLFIRLKTSILCRNVVHRDGKTSFIDLISEIDHNDPSSFFIAHEWCCSLGETIECGEEIQLVDPDGFVESHIRVSPFSLGKSFWDTIRIYWEVSDFKPRQPGIYEICTTLIDLSTEAVLFKQMDAFRVV